MTGLLNVLFLAALLLALAHFLLPRQPRVHETHGRLSLRAPLPRLLETSATTVLALLGSFVLLGWLLSLRALLPAGLLALVGVWLGWRLWRRWQAGQVVFDRGRDQISLGGVPIARASDAAGVQVTGRESPALELFLRSEAGSPTAWEVPGVAPRDAPAVGQAIAEFLGVPLSTRVD